LYHVDFIGTGYVVTDTSIVVNTPQVVTTYNTEGKVLSTITPPVSSTFQIVPHPQTEGLLVASLPHKTPAQGLTPASTTYTFSAWSLATGKILWHTPSYVDNNPAELQVADTGQYAITYVNEHIPMVINLSTGAEKRYPVGEEIGTVGLYLDVAACEKGPELGGSNYYAEVNTLVSPKSGAKVSSFQSEGDDECVGPGSRIPPGAANIGPFGINGDNDLGVGLFTADSDGIAEAVVQNGRTLLTHGDAGLTAYSIPSMRKLWSDPDTGGMIGTGGNVLLLQGTNPNTGNVTFWGINEFSGARLWSKPTSDSDLQVCGMSTTQFLVSANSQLVVLELKTGKQLSYSSYNSETCNQMLGGSGASYYNTASVTVKQVLTP
jgi:hypothetical protein